jgi:hypothetical protein
MASTSEAAHAHHDPLAVPSEAFDALEEKQYRAELDLVERYQTFVAELLRLSLAGIAVFGFLYEHVFHDPDAEDPAFAAARIMGPLE